MYRSVNEERMEKQLKGIVRTVIWAGVLLLVGSVLFAMILSDATDRAAAYQLHARTEEYSSRLYEQIDSDYQIMDTFASIIGSSGITDREDFPELLDQANYENDFLTMTYMDVSGDLAAAVLDQEVTQNNIQGIQEEARAVLQEAIEGRRGISRFFRGDLTKEDIIVYGTPVYQEERVVGALAASGRIDIFREILEEGAALEGSGFVDMIDMDGNYMTRSGNDNISAELTNVFSAPYFAEDEAAEMKAELQEKGRLEFSFRYGGEKYRGLIEAVGIHDWCLFSVLNTRMGSREIYMMNRAAGVLFGVIFLLMLGLLAYGCRLVWRNGKRLQRIAYYDPLTGAYNMLRFRQLVEESIGRNGSHYSLIALNVHQFKFINEIYGREQGDRLLRFIKEQIRERTKPGEFFCRETADIFYLYTTETDRDVLEKRLTELMDGITGKAAGIRGDYQLLMCCGAAIASEGEAAQTLDETMTHVMLALTRAKDVHQNNVWFFDRELHRSEIMGNYVEAHMHQALEEREFQLYLQPKVDLASQKVAAAEALVRWIRPDGLMIYPDQFIPLFEANGFCVQLDMYMVDAVCRKLREWMDQGLEPFPISVNQSKRAFYETDYLARLTEIAEKYQVPPELITLEILEGFTFENVDEVNRKIEELQKKGFRVSLDDFGSEYSSMNTLGKIRINELKLDRWFLKDAAKGKENVRVIMEQVIQLAHKLNISTVVEGVETLQDHDLIRKLHCDFGQGYYYRRPISAEEFYDIYLKEK